MVVTSLGARIDNLNHYASMDRLAREIRGFAGFLLGLTFLAKDRGSHEETWWKFGFALEGQRLLRWFVKGRSAAVTFLGQDVCTCLVLV